MAENLTKRPVKGILKASSSFDQGDKNVSDIKWDEMNILQTLHPPDKDYGHMKIEEPKTPYSYYDEEKELSEHSQDCLDANLLAEKINLSSDTKPKIISSANKNDEDDDDDDEYADETDEQRVQRRAFEQKRKLHYNEFQAIKLARKLIAKEDEEDEEEEEEEENEDDIKNGEIEIDK